MAKESEADHQVFDIGRIRELIALMNEHDLSEIELKTSGRRIRLRKGGDMPSLYGVPSAMAPISAPQPASAASTPASSAPTAAAETSDNFIYIKSPMIGSFYGRPKPDKPLFVKVGDIVQPDTIVCIVEAMKTFNELPAGVSGKVVAVLVKDEEPVDVNKPLFKIAPL